MKRVRFIAGGQELQGRYEEGRLISEAGAEFGLEAVKWLPPVVPGKIVGLVLNYKEHADELGLKTDESPILFLKPVSSLIGHLEDIVYPLGATHVHYEAELAVVIGKRGRRIPAGGAMEHVAGYTIANDVTARDYITNTFRPPVKAKGFDTFCPLGPWMATADEIQDPHRLDISTSVNGKTVQSGNTRMFMHPIPDVIAFVSEFMTLLPGDIILTGTPKGISPIHPGDRVDITLEGIGTLSNRVVHES